MQGIVIISILKYYDYDYDYDYDCGDVDIDNDFDDDDDDDGDDDGDDDNDNNDDDGGGIHYFRIQQTTQVTLTYVLKSRDGNAEFLLVNSNLLAQVSR